MYRSLDVKSDGTGQRNLREKVAQLSMKCHMTLIESCYVLPAD
jgi:hypothetical protein